MTRVLVASALAIALVAGSGCRGEHRYESVVQIVRKASVELGDDGKPNVVDMEVEWDPCPGSQFQVIRGDKTFAACTEKYAIGDFVPVVVRHFWDPRGFFTWDIERVGDCARAIESSAPGSYEKSQECKDVLHHGHKVGFACSRKPFRDLVRRCPWTARE